MCLFCVQRATVFIFLCSPKELLSRKQWGKCCCSNRWHTSVEMKPKQTGKVLFVCHKLRGPDLCAGEGGAAWDPMNDGRVFVPGWSVSVWGGLGSERTRTPKRAGLWEFPRMYPAALNMFWSAWGGSNHIHSLIMNCLHEIKGRNKHEETITQSVTQRLSWWDDIWLWGSVM